ncbi:MAG: DegT/DnrJ/EryC1/StrS family aminotransferase [Planctomycetes bacterium]|nr:DegT/DnrJ/EryC1/StrS family aminotransferase [Planctomycetota bacterium]
MSGTKLALFGGPPAITRTFAPYRSIGTEEAEAAQRVLAGGELSRFLGTWHEDFFGGPEIRRFEAAWAADFKVPHAISVNSNTSGLIAAVGAIGIEPGDEVIVSPWTMSATATAILQWNAIPVFADIEAETFNLDPVSIERCITPLTQAILVTDLFGQAAKLDEIMALARRHGLKVIEDAAQAPGALYKGRRVGTLADIGVYSLNYHKHIHTGEGGVCVTHDDHLAERMQLLRNHAEAVVGGKGVEDISNMLGFNFRMTEIEAAIGGEQLKKLSRQISQRQRIAERLSEGLRGLEGLILPTVMAECSHVYYVYALRLELQRLSLSRQKLLEALKAEGVPALGGGYTNIHLLPLYQRKIAYGKRGFPWSASFYQGKVSYERGICPVAETLHESSAMGLQICVYQYPDEDVDEVIGAFHKVWEHLDELRTGP